MTGQEFLIRKPFKTSNADSAGLNIASKCEVVVYLSKQTQEIDTTERVFT